ncbi:MAG: hypothetical protein LUQ65_00945, partial [Candidatus Helarchaeota archaeon]|nr:hypothetical protein [Candidatus Helarchaeota archaeon]
PIDLSLEPSGLDITETPPDSIEMPPETVETETIELTLESTPTPPQTPTPMSMPAETQAPEPLEKQETSAEIRSEPKVAEEEKEAANIISFFKSSVTELTEQEKEEAIKEPEVQKIEEPEIQKTEEPEIQKIEEPEIQKSGLASSSKLESKSATVPFAPKPELNAPVSSKVVSDLVIPSKPKDVLFASQEATKGSDKSLKCVFCGKSIRKEDSSVILCPHACGALGHKAEFIKKGQCPRCKAEVKEIDIAFSELL